jgi:hypothetical protein
LTLSDPDAESVKQTFRHQPFTGFFGHHVEGNTFRRGGSQKFNYRLGYVIGTYPGPSGAELLDELVEVDNRGSQVRRNLRGKTVDFPVALSNR